jgi:nucleoside-diphosphate-sugar epimerase
MPDGATCVVLNTDLAGARDLVSLFYGAGAVIHAAGIDGRYSGPAPAIDAYRAGNIAPMKRLIPAMHEAGARKLVILGSYYTALARSAPQLVQLARNPYPLSRQEQADLAFALAGPDIAVAILELPYIFGGAPGRGTLWGYLIDSVSKPGPVAFPAGGTACVTADQVAEAAVGACERASGHRHYPIGGENLTYQEIYQHFAAALGLAPHFVAVDTDQAEKSGEADRLRLSAAGIETGYDPSDVVRWQQNHLYLDPLPAMQSLGFGVDAIGPAIRATVEATQRHGGQGPGGLNVRGENT